MESESKDLNKLNVWSCNQFTILTCPFCNHEYVHLIVLRCDDEDDPEHMGIPYLLTDSVVLHYCPRCGEKVEKRFG